jgi:hypothetical protein
LLVIFLKHLRKSWLFSPQTLISFANYLRLWYKTDK